MTKKPKFRAKKICTGNLKSIAKFQKFNDFLYLSRVVFFLSLTVSNGCVRQGAESFAPLIGCCRVAEIGLKFSSQK